MSFWPLGIRGKGIRLLNDAGFDVREPLAAGLSEMLIASAKRLRSNAGQKIDDWAVVLAAATTLPDHPTAAAHLAAIARVDVDVAVQAMTTVARQALIKRSELGAS